MVIDASKHDRDWVHVRLSLYPYCQRYGLQKVQVDRYQHYDIRPKQRLGSVHELWICYYKNLGLPHFCFVVFLFCFQSAIPLDVTILTHLFRVHSFFYMTWGWAQLPEHVHMLSNRRPRYQKSSRSLFSIPFIMIQPHVLQWSCVHWSHRVIRGQSL